MPTQARHTYADGCACGVSVVAAAESRGSCTVARKCCKRTGNQPSGGSYTAGMECSTDGMGRACSTMGRTNNCQSTCSLPVACGECCWARRRPSRLHQKQLPMHMLSTSGLRRVRLHEAKRWPSQCKDRHGRRRHTPSQKDSKHLSSTSMSTNASLCRILFSFSYCAH